MALSEEVKRQAREATEAVKGFFVTPEAPARDGFSREVSSRDIIANDTSQVRDSFASKEQPADRSQELEQNHPDEWER